MKTFKEYIIAFKKGEMNINDWNCCVDYAPNGTFGAYIMGCGSEQCLTSLGGFETEEDVEKIFEYIGATRILRGVG